MEGLRSLQIYSDEADQPLPQQQVLEVQLEDALDALDHSFRLDPRDVLTRYYLGLALTMRNQQIYVARLAKLTGPLVALGRSCELLDRRYRVGDYLESDAGKKESSEQKAQHKKNIEQLEKRRWEEERNASPAEDLEKQPWPLLHQAAAHFQQLLGDVAGDTVATAVALRRASAYNLAEVYARLGGDHLEDALKALAQMQESASDFSPPPRGRARFAFLRSSRLPASEIEQRADWEGRALNLQARTLEYTVQARHAIDKWIINQIFETEGSSSPALFAEANHKLTALPDEIRAAEIPAYLKIDLEADYWTKLGYLAYERAVHVYVLHSIGDLDRIGSNVSRFLNLAADHLNRALNLKENWNPAQIYLALVYRVHSGVAEIGGKTDEQERFTAMANDLFDSLLGVLPVAPESQNTDASSPGQESSMAPGANWNTPPAQNRPRARFRSAGEEGSGE